jgi:glyoxylase-like metal-dependent hydrolase (beta-lactamase superfamily II)
MRLWSVEGNHQRLDGGSMFGNVPRAMWQTWLAPDERHRIPLACRALLVEDLNGRRVLFEAGIGAFLEPRLKDRYGVLEAEHVLLRSLEERGTAHDEIDVVVLSHLHFDHAGGLLGGYEPGEPRRLLFPRARFVVSAAAWERARRPHARDRASFNADITRLLGECGRLDVVEGERHPVLSDAVRFHYSDGHTPGLMLSEIGGEAGIVFCSDLIPGRAWVHLPVTMGFDRYPERIIDEKRSFLDDKIARGVRLYFTHDPEVVLATPIRDRHGHYGTSLEQQSLDGVEL